MYWFTSQYIAYGAVDHEMCAESVDEVISHCNVLKAVENEYTLAVTKEHRLIDPHDILLSHYDAMILYRRLAQ